MRLGDILSKSLIAAVAVFFIHTLLIIIFDIYHYISWADVPTHFLGGAAIAGGVIIFFNLLILDKRIDPLPLGIKIVLAIAITFTIAVLWEFYEWSLGLLGTGLYQEGLDDTMLDMALGGLGGVIVSFVYLIVQKNKK